MSRILMASTNGTGKSPAEILRKWFPLGNGSKWSPAPVGLVEDLTSNAGGVGSVYDDTALITRVKKNESDIKALASRLKAIEGKKGRD
jgi:hypothetical protein